MSHVVQISDFKGEYYIAVNSRATESLQSIIDFWEKEYLTKLMGIELRDLFIADLVNGVPQNTEYLKFFNEFEYEVEDREVVFFSKGLKEVLKGLIYYHFISGYNTMHTLTGVVTNSNENSEEVGAYNTERKAEKRWNEIVDSYNLISYKIVEELKLYKYRTEIDCKFTDLV